MPLISASRLKALLAQLNDLAELVASTRLRPESLLTSLEQA